MCNENLESIMAKYLENGTNEKETQIVLEHLMESERDRHIMNLAAAGLLCIQPDNRQIKN